MIDNDQQKREHDELEYLYSLATDELASIQEKLTVWAGGDAPNQQDALIQKFMQRFPNVPIQLTVDLSKFHDIKVYQELLNGNLTPDVVMLQTMNDFENWKMLDVLQPFQPQSFSRLTPGYSDDEGAYLGVYITCFVPQYAKKGVKNIPTQYCDFLAPEFKNRLVLTPPHDDDAVLFVYDHILQKHGVPFLQKLAAQKPRFLRGTAAPAALVGRQKFFGNLTGYLTPPDSPAQSFVPADDFFISWVQRAAMFKLTRHQAAARLFLAYITSYEYQSAQENWSVRQDVDNTPTGLQPLAAYPNTNPLEFITWMRDRKHLHELRAQMQEIFGPVRGQSPLTDPALLRIYRRWS